MSEAPYEFRFLPVEGELTDYVNACITFRSSMDELSDVMPSFSPQLLLFGKGSVTIHFDGSDMVVPDEAFFVTQLDNALPFTIHGPALSVGASLNVLGWAALTRLPVGEMRNRTVGVSQVLGAQIASRIEGLRERLGNGTCEHEAACQELSTILRDGLMPLPDNERRFITEMRAWLGSSFSPQIADLRKRVNMSERQIQRLSKRYFGGAPSSIAKRYRAVRAATVLALPDLPDEVEAEIFDAYYDQAHLIRDLHRYTGRTPRRLQGDTPSFGADTLGLQGYGDAAFLDEVMRLDGKNELDDI